MSRSPDGFWSPPEPALAAAAAEGEQTVARVRLVAMAFLLISPTIKLIREPEDAIHVWGFGVTVLAALAAVAIAWILRVRGWRPAIGFVSSALDVSLVTTALVTFVLVGSPLDAINSKVTFEIYFLALAATSLRYDPRVCVAVGLLAMLEYGSLWLGVAWWFDLRDPVHVSDSGTYTALDQVTRLILLGVAVLVSYTLVRRAQRLQNISSRDRLTGLYNRLHFERALAMEIDRSVRYDHPLALSILDIDHFKSINDRYGHPAGDRVLRAIGERLGTGLRRTDVVARYGGEEFVVLMPETTSALAKERIEQLRQAVAENAIAVAMGRTVTIDFSAGVAGLAGRENPLTAEQLVGLADLRLLAAKRTGRGRTVGDEFDGIAAEPS